MESDLESHTHCASLFELSTVRIGLDTSRSYESTMVRPETVRTYAFSADEQTVARVCEALKALSPTAPQSRFLGFRIRQSTEKYFGKRHIF